MLAVFFCGIISSWFLAAYAACPRATAVDVQAHIGTHCARVYAHFNCGGHHKNIQRETQIRALSGFNDITSSVVVADGCKLTVYEHGGFQGHSRHLFGKDFVYPNLSYIRRGGFWSGGHWNDVISSVKCTCPGRSGGGLGNVVRHSTTTTARP